MRRIAAAFCVFLGCSGLVSQAPIHASTDARAPHTVVTDKGSVAADTSADAGAILAYKGIPFAAPPVGNLRWKAPATPKAWQGVRSGDEFGKACIQGDAAFPVLEVGEQSEDCLYLNVWTPSEKPATALPVIVWIHGGSLTSGSGGIYSGEYIAAKGTVVVSFNYRLNVFGFFTHPSLAGENQKGAFGNYGFLDQIAVLKWVQRNIAQFGGDPRNVTIAGQSSGASSVAFMMSTDAAKGLFHKAIMQSGGPDSAGSSLDDANAKGVALGDRLTCENQSPKDQLACLRNIEPRTVYEAAVGTRVQKSISFRPIIDGVNWPKSPFEVFAAGRQSPVPVLTGTTEDEGAMFVRGLLIFTKSQYYKYLQENFGEYADRVYEAFKPSFGFQAKTLLSRVATAAFYTSPAQLLLKQMAKLHVPVYQYQFTRLAPNTAAYTLGVFHGIDMFYLFGWLYKEDGFTQEDLDLADALQTYWARFAASGNPNTKKANQAVLPQWPLYSSSATRPYIEFGTAIRKKNDLCKTTKSECDLFEEWMMQ